MFDKCKVIVLDNRDIAIRRSLNLCVKRYRLKASEVIILREMSDISPNKLSDLTINSKLIIISHSDQYQCFSSLYGHLLPYKLHQVLLNLGLREVGLISFKGCNIGSGRFLDVLKKLTNDTIKVGYFIGYKGPSITLYNHECVGYLEAFIHCVSFGRIKIPDTYRVKILTGNVKYDQPIRQKKRWMDIFNRDMLN